MEEQPLYLHLLLQFGGGTLAGVAVGYALKVGIRLGLLVLGMVLVLLYALMQAGVLTIHWDILARHLEAGGRAVGAWVLGLSKTLGGSLAGFGAGLWLGFRLR